MAKLVKPEHFKNRVLMTADLAKHVEYVQHFIDLGFDEVYIHNVNRDQSVVHRGLRAKKSSVAAEPALELVDPAPARSLCSAADGCL